MDYMIEFEFCAFALYVLLLLLFTLRKRHPSRSNANFIAIGVLGLVTSATSIILSTYLSNTTVLNGYINYGVSIAYYLAFGLQAMTYYKYISTVTKKTKPSLAERIFVVAATVYVVGTIVSTPFTKLYFYYDESGAFVEGPLFISCYIVPFLVVMVGYAGFMRSWKSFSGYQKGFVTAFTVLSTASIGVQIAKPEVLIANFSIGLFMMMSMLVLQNPNDYIDKATDCFNREAFYYQMSRQMSSEDRYTIVTVRFYGYSNMVRTIGHEATKEFLSSIIMFLRKTFKKSLFYYLGQGTFAITEKRMGKGFEVGYVAETIKREFGGKYHYEDKEIALDPMICIISYPDVAKDEEDFFDVMEYGFSNAVGLTRPYIVTATPDYRKAGERRERILEIMKQAIIDEAYDVYYQPLYHTETGKFSSAEALVRLIDPELGFISPDEFIPLAEQAGMIIDIDNIVFQKVCKFIGSGVPSSLGVDYIEVNLSTVQCMQTNLYTTMRGTMMEYDVAPSQINFEITETAGATSEDLLKKTMEAFIDDGISFSMDDYGTGYSTASYLISLPVDIVKIDKSILWPAMKNAAAMIVLKKTIDMLKSLGKKIVVEGVETEEMVSILTEAGCDVLQGYYYSKPIPKDDYVSYLSKHANAL